MFPCSIWNNHKCLSWFPLRLNTYAMGLRPLLIFNSYSAGIDVRSQNLTSIDVRFWHLKLIPARLKSIDVRFWCLRSISALTDMIHEMWARIPLSRAFIRLTFFLHFSVHLRCNLLQSPVTKMTFRMDATGCRQVRYYNVILYNVTYVS